MAARLPEALADCLEEGLTLDDATLIDQDGGRHPVSKPILAVNSKFFLALFSRTTSPSPSSRGDQALPKGWPWCSPVWWGRRWTWRMRTCTFVRPLIPIKFYVRFWSTTRDLNLAFRRLVGVLVRCQSPSVPSYLKLKLAWQSLSCRVRHSP